MATSGPMMSHLSITGTGKSRHIPGPGRARISRGAPVRTAYTAGRAAVAEAQCKVEGKYRKYRVFPVLCASRSYTLHVSHPPLPRKWSRSRERVPSSQMVYSVQCLPNHSHRCNVHTGACRSAPALRPDLREMTMGG
ncbi:hypothetical protein J6590_059193 [Homalodisca vitripennis]|nr:hypothetical protein J6590_059193 [Homalodisca vitripennis]